MTKYLDLTGLQLYHSLIKSKYDNLAARVLNAEVLYVNVYNKANEAANSAKLAAISAGNALDSSTMCSTILDDILLALDESADLGADAAIAKNAANISQIKVENIKRDKWILSITPVIITEEEYDLLVELGTVDKNRIYYITEESIEDIPSWGDIDLPDTPPSDDDDNNGSGDSGNEGGNENPGSGEGTQDDIKETILKVEYEFIDTQFDSQLKDLSVGDKFGGLDVKEVSSENKVYKIKLDGELTEINKDMFDVNETCKSLDFSACVYDIKPNAFANCNNLTDVTVRNENATVNNIRDGITVNTFITTTKYDQIDPSWIEQDKSNDIVICLNNIRRLPKNNNQIYFRLSRDNADPITLSHPENIKDENGNTIKLLRTDYYKVEDTDINDRRVYVGGSYGVMTFESDIYEIGESVFEDCKDLEVIVIPDSVMIIGNKAFSIHSTVHVGVVDFGNTRTQMPVIDDNAFTYIYTSDAGASVRIYCWGGPNFDITFGEGEDGRTQFIKNSGEGFVVPDSLYETVMDNYSSCLPVEETGLGSNPDDYEQINDNLNIRKYSESFNCNGNYLIYAEVDEFGYNKE